MASPSSKGKSGKKAGGAGGKKKKQAVRGAATLTDGAAGPSTTPVRLVCPAGGQAATTVVILQALGVRARVLGASAATGKLFARVGKEEEGESDDNSALVAPVDAGTTPLPESVALEERAARAARAHDAWRRAVEVSEEVAAVREAGLPLPLGLRARALEAARAAMAALGRRRRRPATAGKGDDGSGKKKKGGGKKSNGGKKKKTK
jgi:hypothetical protein